MYIYINIYTYSSYIYIYVYIPIYTVTYNMPFPGITSNYQLKQAVAALITNIYHT